MGNAKKSCELCKGGHSFPAAILVSTLQPGQKLLVHWGFRDRALHQEGAPSLEEKETMRE